MATHTPMPEEYIKGFPHPTLPKIIGSPTYTALLAMKKLIAANAASIASNNGGGMHGYLGIVLLPAVYATLAAAPYNIPINLGAHTAHIYGATAAQITAATALHREQLREWQECTSIKNALKKQVLDAIDPIYL